MFTTPLLRARVLRPSQLFVRFANTNGQFLDHISQRKLVRVVHEDDHFLFINKPGNITIAGDGKILRVLILTYMLIISFS